MKKIEVVIDDRESKEIKELAYLLVQNGQFSHFNLSIKRLEVGDIIVLTKTKIGNIAFEIKRVVKNDKEDEKSNDFVDSMIDGRIQEQILNLSNNFDNPVFVIVGTYENICRGRNINPNAVAGQIGSIGSKYRCDILHAESDRGALNMIFSYIKHSNLEPKMYPIIRVKAKKQEIQKTMLSLIPSIGKNLAEKILIRWSFGEFSYKMWKEPVSFFMELTAIDGIGKDKASKLFKFITGKKYENLIN